MLAAALGILIIASDVSPVTLFLVDANHHTVLLHFYDGRVRAFWFHSPIEPIEAISDEWTGIIHVRTRSRGARPLPAEQAGPPAPPSFSVPIRIANRLQVRMLGGRWRGEVSNRVPPPFVQAYAEWGFESSFIRLPAWPLVILLMIPPIRRSIFERRRRRRAARNECLTCGYSLRALVVPRCPECGTPIAIPTTLSV